jgi:hypothetical protein
MVCCRVVHFIYYSIGSSPFIVGTDDDLPPAQNRGLRGRSFSGNVVASAGAFPYMRANNDLESEIHRVEQDAYTGILRAFKVQSDAISWVYNQIETCAVSFISHTLAYCLCLE